MENKVSEIISGFLKIPPSQLQPEQKIDRKAIGSSIALHRMYARLAESGISVDDYHTILTYGDLLTRIGKTEIQPVLQPAGGIASSQDSGDIKNQALMPAGIGIDMEKISEFPAVSDYRSDQFYLMNFSQREISYAILQPNPIQTFAGLFAAKEAVIKADASYRTLPFNEIEIQHNKDGKPYIDGVGLSISHTDEIAVALAVRIENESVDSFPDQNVAYGSTGIKKENGLLVWLAIILSLLALLINFFTL